MMSTITARRKLTGAQAGIWFAQRLDPCNPVFHTAEYVEIHGDLNLVWFEQAVRQAVGEADALHVRFEEDEEGPWQIPVRDSESWTFHHVDTASETDPMEAALAWMRKDLAVAPNLEAGRLFTQALFRLADDHYLWYQRIHHIVMDGYGYSLLAQRTARLYSWRMNGIAGVERGFGTLESMLEEERAYVESEAYRQDRQYWMDRLGDRPDVPSLAERASRTTSSFLRSSAELSPYHSKLLRERRPDNQGGLHEKALAAAAIYLNRITGSEDLVLGVPMMGRFGSVTLNIPGMVMNIIPLRVQVRPEESIARLVGRIAVELKEASRHQKFRHEELRRELKLLGDNSRLFGPMVNIMGFQTDLIFAGCRGKVHSLSAGPVDDLSIQVIDGGEGGAIRLHLDANPEVYTERELQNHKDRLVRLLGSLAEAEPSRPVGQLELLSSAERFRVLAEWNRTEQELPGAPVTRLFELAAARNPEAVALFFRERAVTYKELNEQANRLAYLLRKQGVGEEQMVALALPRSPELIAAMLAVLKCGAAYLPLDPDYPPDRIAYMLEDARPACIMASSGTAGEIPALHAAGVPVFLLDDPGLLQSLEELDGSANLVLRENGLHPAYVLYTSGSTGRPKGVMVTRNGLANFLAAMQEQVPLGAGDRLLAVTTVAFDISGLEIYLPLLTGSCFVLAEKEALLDPQQLAGMLRRYRITVMQATPALWYSLAAHEPDSLRGLRVLVGGEALPGHLTETLHGLGCRITNLYGPTETTIWSTSAELDPDSPGIAAPLIGKPIRNTRVYVLDGGLQPVPVGAAGDLYIAGDGLARGYLRRPELTAERFVADPYGPPGSRMYRTGDTARWLEGGSLDYIGRSDQQVKLRGYRIEPGEIEAVLARHPQVTRAAVMVREDEPGEKRLVGYVASSTPAASREYREYLRKLVPEYMVPSAIVVLPDLPLTPNGKLDRKALPAPGLSAGGAGREPRTPQEEILCGLFAEVLGLPRVGIDDSFFELGGHSLSAVRLMSRIRDMLGAEPGIGRLFETPTVAGLTRCLDHASALRPALVPFERPEGIPLSLTQRRLWFLHLLEGAGPTYNIPLVLRMSGPLNKEALQAALGDVTDRHEILRTLFPSRDGKARQHILEAEQARPRLEVIRAGADDLEQVLREEVRYGFELSSETGFRARLFAVAEEEHVLLLLLHHIAGDGWSLGPLVRDLAAAYRARCDGTEPDLTPLAVQYADYALWQERLLGSENDPTSLYAVQLEYWRQALAGLPEQLDLPVDGVRPGEESSGGDTVNVELPPELHGRLEELARKHKVSLFMVIQAALAALLHRLGAGTDIPIGCPVAGRQDDAAGELVGFFVNTLVLRSDLSGQPSFTELLDRVRRVNLSAYEHQDIPFDRLVEVLNPVRTPGRNPLFQVMLAYQNTPEPDLVMPGLNTDMKLLSVGSSKFDLTLELREHRSKAGQAAGLEGWFEYKTDLFRRSTVERMAARLRLLLEQASEEPDLPIGRLNLLTPEERIMASTLPAANPLTDHTTLTSWFEARTKLQPHSTAVEDAEASWTYAELNERANRLAHRLITMGIGPEDTVALALPRSNGMVAGILGVLKAGAAYLPLDPGYPEERIAYMLRDAGPVCLVTTADSAPSIPIDRSLPVVLLGADGGGEDFMTASDSNPMDQDRKAPLMPDHPAYIIYTSGSTGSPKGVVIPHRNAVRLFRATEHWYGFGSEDAWTLFHSYAFDFSVWEIWGALLYGGRLVVVPHGISRSPADFLKLLAEKKVTVLNQTPSAFYQLMQADREHPADGKALSLRYVIFGGEALELNRLQDWYSRHPDHAPKLVNMYGITETTVHVSYLELDRENIKLNGSSLIGIPIPDLRVYVLDDWLQPAPFGTAGEMYVAGPGLARGYYNRPQLTAERFVADPFGPPGSRMYWTGDLAKRREDGTLDYIGRADQQVKIRGFRIELGEIESVLAGHPSAAQAAVVVREDQPGDKRLTAYIVPNPGTVADPAELRRYAAGRLPDYMVPSAVVAVPVLPLTPNGKLDRKALPAPDPAGVRSGRGPRTPQEEMLCRLFSEVLCIPRNSIGIDDSFFDLGGHSLLAVQLVSRIRDALGAELGIGSLFEAQTVAGLAERLDLGGGGSSLDVLLPLRTKGSQPPLFCVHPAGGLSWCYAGLLKALGPDIPVYGLQARGIKEKGALPESLDGMAADYIRQLRSVQPHGPYRLLGWSLGGNVVQAMAKLLQEQGEEVGLLVMLDAYPNHFLPLQEAPDEREALIALLALGGYDPDSLGDRPLDFAAAMEILNRDGSALANLEESTIRNLKETYVHSVRIMGEYKPGVYRGDVLFFRSTVIPDWFTPLYPDTWSPYFQGGIELVELNCRHKDMCQPEPLAEIGRYLANRLNRSEEEKIDGEPI
ncbi:amino acid adenylation domain-containing protein [Gorillibacterium sp. sgz5001074]|uniref:amino acid adenylation domain-containing protein n=1 Tax=Gorillibacterium sp. sgz5001074 TaxID=3446695 RepID=UPI003F67A143